MEEWKDIKGYEGLYRISNIGKVLSLNYRNYHWAKELVPKKNNNGYLWVELRKDGKSKPFLIHRLVAEAFIENPNNYPLVNHKDENPLNCEASNLEWCTQKYNVLYSMKKHPKRAKNPRKLLKAVNQIDMDGNIICHFANICVITREKGYHNTSIKECCEHKRKTAYGYKWEYAN